MPSVAVCNLRGITDHTVDGTSGPLYGDCWIPRTWGWWYRTVVTAIEVLNGNLIGVTPDLRVGFYASINRDGSGHESGSAPGAEFFKSDAGMGTLDFAGSWTGYRASDWTTPVGVPDPLSTITLYGGQAVNCIGAFPSCVQSVTWRLEVMDENGVILDPLDGVPVVSGPPGAAGIGGPCNCPPFDATGGGSPTRNQPVRNEVAGTGDGATTVFTTAFPYVPHSLQVEVAGFVVPVDPTGPAAGTFTILGAPPTGARITASYHAA
ncbi:MAG TPA: hypothetical protein VJ850_09685 [Candidatus Limnocylindrales bacterium]|nr:hypothetical protein [Candidatus Limnocylindrales bacterium]